MESEDYISHPVSETLASYEYGMLIVSKQHTIQNVTFLSFFAFWSLL
jgi:hypothetical protein